MLAFRAKSISFSPPFMKYIGIFTINGKIFKRESEDQDKLAQEMNLLAQKELVHYPNAKEGVNYTMNIHKTVEVTHPKIGKGTKIWHPELSNIHEGAEIGENCKIHSHVWIGDEVKIGNNVKIEAFTFIPPYVTIEDNVFIGPRVTFTNDKNPPSGKENWLRTLVKSGASIGAGATILPGITINQNARVGAGAVVTKNVSSGVTVCGNPAQVHNKNNKHVEIKTSSSYNPYDP